MKHTYQLTGMTCTSCEAKVKDSLLALADVTNVEVSKESNTATIVMNKHIALNALQEAIGGDGSKYKIASLHHNKAVEETKSWFANYKPLLLIFAFIIGVSLIASRINNVVNGLLFMNYFMGGFFIVFSFFKFLDLKGFAESYAMYDIIAMNIKGYGFVYPFIELGLGVAYLTSFNPTITNLTTVAVMGISSIGVAKSVMHKQKIRCACLGAVFNLPMSTVTIIEDMLMVGMAGMALITKM